MGNLFFYCSERTKNRRPPWTAFLPLLLVFCCSLLWMNGIFLLVRTLILAFFWKLFTFRWSTDKVIHNGGWVSTQSFLDPTTTLSVVAELEEVFAAKNYPPNRPPRSFGSFESIEWSLRSEYLVPSGNKLPIPPKLNLLAKRLQKIAPEQMFDILSVHRMIENDFVVLHQDPPQQMGVVILTALGTFHGGELLGNDDQCIMKKSGDLAMMLSNVPGAQRTPHKVTPLTSGTRFSITLCTLILPKLDSFSSR